MKKIDEKTIQEVMILIGEAHFPNTPIRIVDAIRSKIQALEEIEEPKKK